MSEVVIKLENLTKKFGSLIAVNNINISVSRGEIIGLVGPNGAGKTTTIKMIAKLLRPTSGRILVRTNSGELEDLSKISRTLSNMGFLIDIPAFYNMTAYDLLKYFAKLQNYPRDKIESRIDELLEKFDLSEWKHANVNNFSKGMTQKLGLIQALIHDPEIIILDEPQTGLDPLARIKIRQILKELKDQGKTVFVASHLLYEISEICDKIALINHGMILGFDTVENLEKYIKVRTVSCQVLEPIEPQVLGPLIKRMNASLEPYLDKNLDKKISKIPIRFKPDEQAFEIYYDGKEQSLAEILKILVNEFEADFTIVSFSKPRTSRLEMIYEQIIGNDEESSNKLNKVKK